MDTKLILGIVVAIGGLVLWRYVRVPSTARGVRNNNPGNIRTNPANRWEGADVPQTDSEFVVFRSPVYGIRAMVKTLKSYYFTHGLRTIREIINRWAPPGDNDTRAYISSVVRHSGIAEDQTLNWPRDLDALVRAIINHEVGSVPYDDVTIQAGIFAGLES